MAELSEGEQYLLQQIRRGDGEAWSTLVARYQGRLLAFARGRLRQSADAEDVVQETFYQFLNGLAAFRADASVETYLFTILRRKLVDVFRGKHLRLCSLQDAAEAGGGTADTSTGPSQFADSAPTPSWYAR